MRTFRSTLTSLFVALPTAVLFAQNLSIAKPGQAGVASKTAKFSTISSSNPNVKKALTSMDQTAGLRLVGKTGSFTGTVVSVYAPRSNAEVFIDFSEPWKNSISGRVSSKNFAKFPDLTILKGKKVLITGKFSAYQVTHAEVEIVDISGIKIVN